MMKNVQLKIMRSCPTSVSICSITGTEDSSFRVRGQLAMLATLAQQVEQHVCISYPHLGNSMPLQQEEKEITICL